MFNFIIIIFNNNLRFRIRRISERLQREEKISSRTSPQSTLQTRNLLLLVFDGVDGVRSVWMGI